MSSDSPPDLHMLNMVVRDMAARRDSCRRLGIAVPGPGDAIGAHVQLRMPGGFSLELDTAESARLWHAGGRADPASVKVVLGFLRPAWQTVDDRHAELTSAGYRGRQPPSGAFWGARYAIVADPDGNDVGLMSPVEDSRRTWPPPPAVPRARRQTRSLGGTPPDGYHNGSRSLTCPDAGRRDMPRDRARHIRSRVRK